MLIVYLQILQITWTGVSRIQVLLVEGLIV